MFQKNWYTSLLSFIFIVTVILSGKNEINKNNISMLKLFLHIYDIG